MSGPGQDVVSKQTQGFGVMTAERSAELSAIASAAAAKARVESAYVMAIKNPRRIDDARAEILRLCLLPNFAVKAKYRKPVGKDQAGNMTYAEGPSIRFAEAALQTWGNVDISQTVIYEDDQKRKVAVLALDLEKNVNYYGEILLNKTAERSSDKGREVLGTRTNSRGDKVFIVAATEDEIQIKQAALVSKMIRNNGLRLIPEHITEEAMKACRATMQNKAAQDPDAERKEIVGDFFGIGVRTADLERYLGHAFAQASPAELVELRDIFNSIKEGSAHWSEFVGDKPKDEPGDDDKAKIADLNTKLKEQRKATKAAEPKAAEPGPAAKTEAPKTEPPAEQKPETTEDTSVWTPNRIESERRSIVAQMEDARNMQGLTGIFNRAMEIQAFTKADRDGFQIKLKDCMVKMSGAR